VSFTSYVCFKPYSKDLHATQTSNTTQNPVLTNLWRPPNLNIDNDYYLLNSRDVEEVRSKEGLYDPMDIYVHVWGLLRHSHPWKKEQDGKTTGKARKKMVEKICITGQHGSNDG
jgi:hypothetical protein